jgi:RNA polymerase sigma-70 factor (ECF subfamily)
LKEAFILFELEDMSVPQIAEMLAIPTGTVASRLRRARALFQKAVAELRGQEALYSQEPSGQGAAGELVGQQLPGQPRGGES